MGNSRIQLIDALRGAALLAILLANLPVLNAEIPKGSADYFSEMLFTVLIDKKFITLFSILFGFGFYKQLEKAETRGVNFRRYFLIRMALLFIIGMLHGYLLWFGDIITVYALGGSFLLLLYKMPEKKLIWIAGLFIILLTGILFIGNAALGWQKYDYDYSLAGKFPLVTTYAEYIRINRIMNPWSNFLQDMPITLTFTFGNMILGMVLARLNFFVQPGKKALKFFLATGLTLGLAASITFYLIEEGTLELTVPLLWVPFILVAGMVLQTLAYISLFIRIYGTQLGRSILSVFEPVGKMALSNYLLQSVFYITVFYHFSGGFQLYGKLSLTQTYLLGVVLFALQVGVSAIWLKKFKQGPVEYMWKKMAYRFFA